MQLSTYLDTFSPSGTGSAAPVLKHGGYTFGVLRGRDDLDPALLRSYDGVIVDAGDAAFAAHVVRVIRAHVDLDVYLKPIFVYDGGRLDAPTAALTDGELASLKYLDRAAEQTARIAEQVERFQTAHSVSFEDTVLTKLLRFVVSRDLDGIEPLPSRAAKLGFAYPILDVNYEYQHEHRGHDLLALAEDEGLLRGTFVEAWYVCSTCQESHIHLREVCPSCGVAQVREEELIHHFRCAYVGPVSDFTDELHASALVCPKCERSLHHIGVDYDKPSSIFTCANGHTSQNPTVKARCFHCHADTPAEALTKKVFQRYTLTSRGREQAQTGVMASVQRLSEIQGTVDPAVFSTMLGYERERVRATGAASALAVVRFANADTLFSFISRDERVRLLSTFVGVLRKHLRPADVVALTSFSTLAVLLPAMAPASAQERLEGAAAEIAAWVADRYEGYASDVRFDAAPISTDDSHEAQLEALADGLEAHA